MASTPKSPRRTRKKLSHVDGTGKARMVDISGKPATLREATARGWLKINAEALRAVRSNSLEKGDILAVGSQATAGRLPDRIVLLDIEPETARARLGFWYNMPITPLLSSANASRAC